MRIVLTAIESEPLEFSEAITLGEEVGGEDLLSLTPVRLAGKVAKYGPGYVVTGSIEAQGELRCVRCLEGFGVAFSDRFRVQLQPVALAPQDDDVRLVRKDLDVRFFAEPTLDLSELAAEQLELLLPMKPLCREDCQGLCPHCGTNLNVGRCRCAEREERWLNQSEPLSFRRN